VLVFLTPLAALAILAVVVPIAAALLRERRDGTLRRAVGLAAPRHVARFGSALAAAAVLAFLAAAAAQPAVRLSEPLRVVRDAQVYFVLDVTRSMAASHSPRSATRFERASALGVRIRNGLAGVPAGVASLADRVLPHLFPTVDERVLASVVHRSLGIERPPPESQSFRATRFIALEGLATGYFDRGVRHRLAVVITDGETMPFDAAPLTQSLASAHIGLMVVRVWGRNETIYGRRGRPDPKYRPDLSATARLAHWRPALVGRRIFGEGDAKAVVAAARAYLGRGPTATRGRRERTLRLGPYVALAAALPLVFLLRRRDPR